MNKKSSLIAGVFILTTLCVSADDDQRWSRNENKRVDFTAIAALSPGYIIKNVMISYLRTYRDYAVVTLASAGPNQENCTKANAGKWVAIDLSRGENNVQYEAILAAYLAASPVSLRVSGCIAWEENSITIPNVHMIGIHSAGGG